MSPKQLIHHITACCIFSIIFLIFPLEGQAQEADSTKRSYLPEPESPAFRASPHRERSTNAYRLPESGIFEAPPSTNDYHVLPFRGQHYLDLAVQTYREELKNNGDLAWLVQLNSFTIAA